MIGKQHLEDCEWTGVERGNTVVYLWSFSLFGCGIEVWFIVLLSVAVEAGTAIFPQSHRAVIVFFFEWSLLTVATSWVGRMHLHVASGARGCGP